MDDQTEKPASTIQPASQPPTAATAVGNEPTILPCVERRPRPPFNQRLEGIRRAIAAEPDGPIDEPDLQQRVYTTDEVDQRVGQFLNRKRDAFDSFRALLSETDKADNLLKLAQAVGSRYALASFESFEVYARDSQEPAIAKLRDFLDRLPEVCRLGGGLILRGEAGTGKDHLLIAAAKVAIARYGISVRWIDGGELLDLIAEAIADGRPRALIRELRQPHILAISDPQPPRGELSDAMLRRFRDIVDDRYRHAKPIWITTNVTDKERVIQLFTEPVAQRLQENSEQIGFSWPTYRRKH